MLLVTAARAGGRPSIRDEEARREEAGKQATARSSLFLLPSLLLLLASAKSQPPCFLDATDSFSEKDPEPPVSKPALSHSLEVLISTGATHVPSYVTRAQPRLAALS